MEHDEKRKSHEDEIPLAGLDDHEEHSPGENAGGGVSAVSSTTDMSRPPEADFGAPKRKFSNAAPGRRDTGGTSPASNPSSNSSSSTSSSAGASLPLGEDTGWQSGASIGRMGARSNTQPQEVPNPFILGPEFMSPMDEALQSQPRQQATVMPFPGQTMSRPYDQPSSGGMLRDVHQDDNVPADDDYYGDSGSEHSGDDDGDSLAGAVQLALRSVYGNRSNDAGDDDGDEGDGFMVAGTLMGGGSARIQDFNWPQENATWQEDESSYQEKEQETASAEANTEAVLEYLYGRRRPEHEGVELTLDTALRDFDPTPGQGREWDEQYQDDDRSAPFPGLRELDPQYRGGHGGEQQRYGGDQQRYSGDMSRRTEEEEWDQQVYSNLPMRPGAQVYSSQPDQLTGGSDSGHLLGAAGLGLIGGIALAGVLAVFVFNSFIDVNDTGGKVDERLAMSSPSGQSDGPVYNRAQRAAPTDEARMVPQGFGADQPRLVVQGVSGLGGEPIKLDIAISNPSKAEDALVSIKGLPKDAELSTGIDVGGGQWLLPPVRLKGLSITVPDMSAGSHELAVQLLKDDAQTSLTGPVQFPLNVKSTKQPEVTQVTQPASGTQGATGGTTLPDEQSNNVETDLLTQMLIRDGNKAMREGDIAAARRLYEQASQSGNPEAALAMGRSFDPTYFEKLNVKTGKPDPATAFEWYKKALDGGLITARVKIDALKQWLQR